MKEQWKAIKDFEMYYLISNTGRVISLEREITTSTGWTKTKKMAEMKAIAGKDGYMRINLSVEGNKKSYTIHRLVANAFIENPDGLPQVNHIDCDKSNNNEENLEWTDASGNQKHAFENGLNTQVGDKNSRAKVSNEFVLNIKMLHKNGTKRKKLMEDYSIPQKSLDRYLYGWKHLNEAVISE